MLKKASVLKIVGGVFSYLRPLEVGIVHVLELAHERVVRRNYDGVRLDYLGRNSNAG